MWSIQPQAAFVARENSAAPIVYSLYDQFTTNASAPLTTPRTCEPGPGTLTIVDTNSIISIASNQLTINGTPAANDRVVMPSTTARTAGRAFLVRVPSLPTTIATSGSLRVGFDATAANSNIDIGFDFAAAAPPTSYRLKSASSVIDTFVFPTFPMDVACVMQATGGFFFVRGGGSGDYTLVWIYNTVSTAEFAKIYCNSATSMNLVLDDMRITDLGGAFATTNGLAIQVETNSTANETFPSTPANVVMVVTVTAATGVAQEVRIRWTDDSNCWIIRMAAPGTDTIKLIQKQTGTETVWSTGAQVFVNATQYRLVITADTQTIKTYVNNVNINTYTSASFNQTVAGAKVDTAGMTVTIYPRTVTING